MHDAQVVPFPDERLPRVEPRHAHIWLRLSGRWVPAVVSAWVRTSTGWVAWVQHDREGTPWSRFDWFAAGPGLVPRDDDEPPG